MQSFQEAPEPTNTPTKTRRDPNLLIIYICLVIALPFLAFLSIQGLLDTNLFPAPQRIYMLPLCIIFTLVSILGFLYCLIQLLRGAPLATMQLQQHQQPVHAHEQETQSEKDQ